MHDRDVSDLSDRDFLAAFEAAEIPPEAFSHTAHVRAAFLLLEEEADFAPALVRMKAGLKALVAKAGVPEKYHETITVAFLALVHERMARSPGNSGRTKDGAWRTFSSANRDLFQGNPLSGLYSGERFRSALARDIFLLPDRPA